MAERELFADALGETQDAVVAEIVVHEVNCLDEGVFLRRHKTLDVLAQNSHASGRAP